MRSLAFLLALAVCMPAWSQFQPIPAVAGLLSAPPLPPLPPPLPHRTPRRLAGATPPLQLRFRPDGTFKIIQLTDLHYGEHPEKDVNTTRVSTQRVSSRGCSASVLPCLPTHA